eukprot:CAMPEP_0113882090 /NCGR_PEP_ID=MMETSP0780_2-20120614/8745_1 /TAXON_ID=652834 /ORGANISM="Palpitomonas bilix" /LENGTH=289 /DNA_ID=CAMNT_0000869033 /DNA_START=127 /DNA_END=996 /DNA_ORIENTATION=+ /assembly_acc=CAM_ASM_000599
MSYSDYDEDIESVHSEGLTASKVVEESVSKEYKQKRSNFTALWKTWETKSLRHGARHTIFNVDGTRYKGEWDSGKRHGHGIQIYKSGNKYEGDWQDNKRHGLGAYWVISEDGRLRLQFKGQWENDKRGGFGTLHFNTGDVYEGEWKDGKREGAGKQYYADGSMYDGEWKEGMRWGQGVFVQTNGNCYQGGWVRDMKEGQGTFFFYDKRQRLDGEWREDVSKCGEITDFDADEDFVLPVIGLSKPSEVLMAAMEEVEKQRVEDEDRLGRTLMAVERKEGLEDREEEREDY